MNKLQNKNNEMTHWSQIVEFFNHCKRIFRSFFDWEIYKSIICIYLMVEDLEILEYGFIKNHLLKGGKSGKQF